MFDLTGMTALVTGAGYGLGRGLVHGLVAHGATVIGLARSADALRRDLLDAPGAAPLHRRRPHRPTRSTSSSTASPSTSTSLVNNAGGDPHSKPWGQQTTEEWRDTYEINVIAAERLCRLLTPKMAAKGFGRVINISSIYGSIGQNPRNTGPRAGAGAYTAAKHGLIGLTHYLACQIGRTGVTINTLSPGMITWIETPERARP